MVFCIKCKRRFKDEVNFCPYCGIKISPESALSDAVRQLQAGDQQAFDIIYNLTEGIVAINIVKNGVNEADREDVAQEAFVKILGGIGTLNDPDAAYGWVKSVAANTAKDFIKKSYVTHESVVLDSSDEEDDRDVTDAFDSDKVLSASFDMPEDVLENAESRRLVEKMIAELPERQQCFLMDFYYNELSIKDIAEKSGVAEGTIKSDLSRARKTLGEKISELEKKQGIRLHSVSGILVFGLIFSEEAKASAAAIGITAATKAKVISAVCQSMGMAGSAGVTGTTAAASGTAGVTGASAAASGTAGATGASAAASAGAAGLGYAKIAAIVVSVSALAIGGAYTVPKIMEPKDEAIVAEADIDETASSGENEEQGEVSETDDTKEADGSGKDDDQIEPVDYTSIYLDYFDNAANFYRGKSRPSRVPIDPIVPDWYTYDLYDWNGDGVPEIIFYGQGAVYGNGLLYIKDGEVRVIMGDGHSTIYHGNDHIMIRWGQMGVVGDVIYECNNGRYDKVFEGKYVESDDLGQGDPYWEINGQKVSEEEYHKAFEGYYDQEDWIEISPYEGYGDVYRPAVEYPQLLGKIIRQDF